MRKSALLGLVLWCAWASPAAAARVSPPDVVSRALEASPALDGQEASTRQARRDVRVGAVDFVPTVELSGTYTRLSDLEMPPFEFGGMQIESPFPVILDNYAFKTTVTWPVSDLFFSILPGHQARIDALELQRHQEAVERNKVAKSALEAYYQLVRVRAGIQVADDGVKVLEAQVERLEGLFEAGLVTRADVLSAGAQLAEARVQADDLRGLAEVAEAHLQSVLQIPEPLEVEVPDGSGTDAEIAPLDPLVEDALAQRPEVQLLDRLINVHKHAAAANRGAALPHVALVGNYTHANPNQRVIPSTKEFRSTWDATVAVTWSPGEAIRRGNAASQSHTDELKARADREALVRGVRVQVAQARSGLVTAERVVRASHAQVEAAEAAFTAQSDLLSAGRSTPTDVLTAEAALRRARHAELNARVDLRMARVELDHALGALIDSPEEIQ